MSTPLENLRGLQPPGTQARQLGRAASAAMTATRGNVPRAKARGPPGSEREPPRPSVRPPASRVRPENAPDGAKSRLGAVPTG